MKNIAYYIHTVILLLLQIIIFNNIQISSYINISIYLLIIFFLPFQINATLLMIGSFFLGIVIDISAQTVGINTVAATLIAFFRPRVMLLLAPREQLDNASSLSRSRNINWFFQYMFILIFTFFVVYNLFEVFSFRNFGITCIRIIASSLTTFFFVFIYYVIAIKQNTKSSDSL